MDSTTLLAVVGIFALVIVAGVAAYRRSFRVKAKVPGAELEIEGSNAPNAAEGAKDDDTKAGPKAAPSPASTTIHIAGDAAGWAMGTANTRISNWEHGRAFPKLHLLFPYLAEIDADLHDLQDVLDELAGEEARR